ncbi:MAG: hypothetical protein ABIP51_20780 [Bacteroidia bacterium]
MKHVFFKISGTLFFSLLISCSTDKGEKTGEITTQQIVFDTLAIGDKIYRSLNIPDSDYVFENFESDGIDSLAILKCNGAVFRENDTLILKCNNGKIIRLKNIRSEEDNMEFYNFIGLNKDINAYIITRSLYEAFDVWLINKQTGDSLITIGFPAVSPDKKKFVCTNVDLEAAFSSNGIELFKNEDNKYTSVGFRELNDWGPERAMWKNDTTLIIKAMQRADPGKTATLYKALYIK